MRDTEREQNRHWDAPTVSVKPVTWATGFAELRSVRLEGRQEFANHVPLHSLFLKRSSGAAEAEVRIGDEPPQPRVTRPGDITFVPADQVFHGNTRGSERYDYTAVFLSKEIVGNCLIDGDIVEHPSARPDGFDLVGTACTRDPAIVLLLQRLTGECERLAAGHRLYLESLGIQLVLELVRNYSSLISATDTRSPLADVRLRRVIEVMNDRLDNDLDLEELARVAGLSIYHFARAFRQATGASPYSYLTELRMERARELLQWGGTPIKVIAGKVGYASASRFSKAFLKTYRVTPAQFRVAAQ